MPTVIKARIIEGPYGENTVEVILWTEGQWVRAFSYFNDELEFTESEFIGLTLCEVENLHLTKDRDYLRS
jgi:hypothetical protein